MHGCGPPWARRRGTALPNTVVSAVNPHREHAHACDALQEAVVEEALLRLVRAVHDEHGAQRVRQACIANEQQRAAFTDLRLY